MARNNHLRTTVEKLEALKEEIERMRKLYPRKKRRRRRPEKKTKDEQNERSYHIQVDDRGVGETITVTNAERWRSRFIRLPLKTRSIRNAYRWHHQILAASNVVIFSETDKNKLNLTEEAMSFIENGSPEARAFDFVKKKARVASLGV